MSFGISLVLIPPLKSGKVFKAHVTHETLILGESVNKYLFFIRPIFALKMFYIHKTFEMTFFGFVFCENSHVQLNSVKDFDIQKFQNSKIQDISNKDSSKVTATTLGS